MSEQTKILTGDTCFVCGGEGHTAHLVCGAPAVAAPVEDRQGVCGYCGKACSGKGSAMCPKYEADTQAVEDRQGREEAQTVYYVAQERAMAPGVVTDWPDVIKHPKDKNGRLVKLAGAAPVDRLREYVQHKKDCVVRPGRWYQGDCTCGLRSLLAGPNQEEAK